MDDKNKSDDSFFFNKSKLSNKSSSIDAESENNIDDIIEYVIDKNNKE